MERVADGPRGRRAAKGGGGGGARRQLRRRRASDARRGDVTPGEFVRLAAAIDRCAAFNPQKWRAVLDKSAMVLRASDSVAAGYAGADEMQREKRVDVRCGVRNTTSRPSSRDEDAKQSAASTSGSFGYGVFPPLSVSQYLNQPAIVESILRENDVDEGQEVFDDSRFLQSDAEMHEESQANRDSYDGNSEKEDEVIEYGESPANIAASDKQVTPLVVLPLLTTVSPRTRRGIARLPAPSEADMREIQNLERLAGQPDRSHDFYRALKRTQLQNARHQQMKNLLPAQKPTLQALTSTQSSSPPKHRKFRHGTQVQKPRGSNAIRTAQLPLRLRGEEGQQLEESERKRMEAEDPRAGLFVQPTGVASSSPPASPVRTLTNKHTRDYNLLVRDQQRALSQERAVGIQVKHTIDEIKHWMPLDVIYAFGLGEFASPAQQRATEGLLHVGLRLRSQMLVQGMRQWKNWVFAVQQYEQEQASLRMQCWWRQICAAQEVAMRRRLHNELLRKQEAFVILLANKQQQAAFTITRCIRGYVHELVHARLATQQNAASCIQRFWLRSCALWAALRRQMLKQQRHKAAICVQKHARRLAAQRKMRLLRKINHVETRRRQRELMVSARRSNMKTLGAVVTIQRAFRNWQQRRILRLRRRRAAFEKDKRKIIQVQAHYRGQQARKLVEKHRRDVFAAVCVLHSFWRCYQARRELQQRKERARAQRDQLQLEVEEHRRSRQTSVLAPMQLKKKWGQFALLKATTTSTGGPRR